MVGPVVDELLLAQTASGLLDLGQVEGLGLVEVVAVSRTNLVRVLVLLSSPASAVPKLTVTLVARDQIVGPRLDFKLGHLFKCHVWGAVTEIGFVVNIWVLEACSRRGRVVVDRSHVGRSLHLSASTKSAACRVQRAVLSRDQLVVKSSCTNKITRVKSIK